MGSIGDFEISGDLSTVVCHPYIGGRSEVLPILRVTHPRLRFLIVGSRPTSAVRRLERHAGVTVTGYVEDVRVYLAQADVCVVPLRIARGSQNKVLEAMAMGLALVTTPQAAEGIELLKQKGLGGGDSPQPMILTEPQLVNGVPRISWLVPYLPAGKNRTGPEGAFAVIWGTIFNITKRSSNIPLYAAASECCEYTFSGCEDRDPG